MAVDRFFDVAWVDIEAAADDHVLGTVDQVDKAVVRHVAHIAGPHEPVGGHHLGGGNRIVPVAFHDLRTADADFAALAQREIGERREIDHLDLSTRHRHAAGPGRRRAGAGRKGTDPTDLGHAPAFEQSAARHAYEITEDLASDWRAAGVAPLERRQVGALDVGVADEADVHRRHAKEDGDFAFFDFPQRRRQVEALVHHELGADGKAEDHVQHHRVDVEHRQHHQESLGPAPQRSGADQHLFDLRHCHAEVRVRKHRALGVAGGAARVLQHRNGRQVGGGRQKWRVALRGHIGETHAPVVPGNAAVSQFRADLEFARRTDDQSLQSHAVEVAVYL